MTNEEVISERVVKDRVKKLLKTYNAWYYMPVPGGYGEPTIDFLCSINGVMFGIETKASGKKPRARQIATMVRMNHHGIRTFVVDGSPRTIKNLTDWLDWVGKYMPVVNKLLGKYEDVAQPKD